MDHTYLYTLRDGQDPSNPDNWQDRGAVLSESQYYRPTGFVDPNTSPNPPFTHTQHLWAPTHFAWNNTNFLLVPDIADNSAEHTSSKIGISTSASLFGPYTFQKTYNVPTTGPNGGYASDPGFATTSD